MQRMNEVMARRLQQAEAAAQQAMEQAQQVGGGVFGCKQVGQGPYDVSMLCSRTEPGVQQHPLRCRWAHASGCHQNAVARQRCLPLATRKPAQARRAMDEYVNLGAPLEGPVKLSPSSSIAGGWGGLQRCGAVMWPASRTAVGPPLPCLLPVGVWLMPWVASPVDAMQEGLYARPCR
jgi:hypothetical protein